jgi:hypothetical protein
MATTISGTTVTFTDGSTWGGANGGLTVDGNTDRAATAFNIGHLILANTIFWGNSGGFSPGGENIFALNGTQRWYTGRFAPANYSAYNPGANYAYPANDSRLGSQSYYVLGTSNVAGTWRSRGMACGAGINQTVGYFVLLERVA